MAVMYLIEKNIPRTRYVKNPPKYPFRHMQVTDSFAFEEAIIERVRSAVQKFQNKEPVKFSVMKVGYGKARCWRVV